VKFFSQTNNQRLFIIIREENQAIIHKSQQAVLNVISAHWNSAIYFKTKWMTTLDARKILEKLNNKDFLNNKHRNVFFTQSMLWILSKVLSLINCCFCFMQRKEKSVIDVTLFKSLLTNLKFYFGTINWHINKAGIMIKERNINNAPPSLSPEFQLWLLLQNDKSERQQ